VSDIPGAMLPPTHKNRLVALHGLIASPASASDVNPLNLTLGPQLLNNAHNGDVASVIGGLGAKAQGEWLDFGLTWDLVTKKNNAEQHPLCNPEYKQLLPVGPLPHSATAMFAGIVKTFCWQPSWGDFPSAVLERAHLYLPDFGGDVEKRKRAKNVAPGDLSNSSKAVRWRKNKAKNNGA
jgi:hypothetical protein